MCGVCVVFLCYCPQEVREMVRGAYERAVTLLTENSSKLKEASTCTYVCVCVYGACTFDAQVEWSDSSLWSCAVDSYHKFRIASSICGIDKRTV